MGIVVTQSLVSGSQFTCIMRALLGEYPHSLRGCCETYSYTDLETYTSESIYSRCNTLSSTTGNAVEEMSIVHATYTHKHDGALEALLMDFHL